MAVVGVLGASVVGFSSTIWYLLQNISGYLSVPMAAASFIGLLWKHGTTKGAVTAVSVGFAAGLVCFLDQALNLSLPGLSHPYLNSFLHRSLLSAAVMVGVSLATAQPPGRVTEENVFHRFRQPWTGLGDYRTWAVFLFSSTVALWWFFR